MKISNNKRKGKSFSYNIFNDLLEAETDDSKDENQISDNEDESENNDDSYFYDDEKVLSEEIIKYPEKNVIKPEQINQTFIKQEIYAVNFPPLISSPYPPGLEYYNSNDIIRNIQSQPLNQPQTYHLLQRNSSPIEIKFLPNINKIPLDFSKEKSNKFLIQEPLPHPKIYHKNDFTFRDIKGQKNKNIIPTKKFVFGNRGNKDVKCIKSFGIILFVNENNYWRNNTTLINQENIKYLLYQRRDTYAFMDFMRGLWNDDAKMFTLLSQISKDERKRLLTFSFDDLWEDLWVSHSIDVTGIYIAGKDRAKKKFNSVKDKIFIFLEQTNTSNIVCDAPWGFPKGKKNSKETDIDCAIREFCEETKFNITKNDILTELGTIIEWYEADNNKYYTTFYYIAQVPNLLPVKYINTPGCIRTSAVSDEVSNLIWATYSDSTLLLDEQKKCILNEAHSRIINN